MPRAPGAPALDPDAPAPLTLPVALPGTWKRDWRWGRSLVGKGGLQLSAEGITITAGRTSWVRGGLVLLVRLIAVAGFLAGCGAAVLTAIGLTVRTRTPEWLGSALVAIPLVLAGSMLVGWLARVALERTRSLTVPWSALDHLQAVGPTIELRLWHEGRPVVGRFRPRRFTVQARNLLQELRRGQAPLEAHRLGAPLRSRRVDQAGLLAGFIAACGLAWLGWPSLRPLLAGPPTHGPEAGVPDRLASAELEALAQACPRGPDSGAAVRNRREGKDLHWSREAGDGHATVHLLRRPDGKTVLLARSSDERGTVPGAFAEGGVAFSLSVREDRALEVARLGETEGLAGALCSGAVGRLDRSRGPGEAEAGEGLRVSLRRDGADLVVTTTGEGPKRLRLLAARQRDSSRLDWLDRCEVAVVDGALVMPRLDEERRLSEFFGSSRDEARVVVLPAGRDEEVRARLAPLLQTDDGAVPCIAIDALAWEGPALALGKTARSGGPLAEAAADLARSGSLPAATADELVQGLDARYARVRAALQPQTRAEWQAVDQGFLDGLPWSRILDTVSMQHDLAQLERIRQRLSGADGAAGAGGAGQLGELFLLRLAEELLERIPPEGGLDAWNARVDVAEAWLAVDQGTTWTTGGRTVRVPSPEVAAYYQVVGHYLLVDVARRAESRMSRDLGFRVIGLPLRWRLENHGINLDIEKSSAQKALEAWVKGDFEYLGDRALARLAEQVSDQAQAIQAATDARYRLTGQWSASDGAARTARLLRDDQEIGWVALYDQDKVALGYHHVGGKGTSRAALGRGRPVLLATAGSYVTGDLRTAGLSARDGAVDNFLISNKMDGLVIVDRRGRLAMLDMRHGGTLPEQQAPVRPLESLADLHLLLRWLEDHDASAFQTHLLGYGGQLTIDPGKASGELRERRLLVQAAWQGHPIIAIVDLPGTPKLSLFEAAVVAVQALRTPEAQGGPGLDVVAVANLDVGSYNALEAWTDDGQGLRQSWKPLGETMNLISVARR